MGPIATNANEIPAKAGTQYSADSVAYWIPAFAGISNDAFLRPRIVV